MIFYACVSRHVGVGSVVGRGGNSSAATSDSFEILGQRAAILGNFEDVALVTLGRINVGPDSENRQTLTEGKYSFHYQIERSGVNETFLILCITSESFSREKAFQFLNKLSEFVYKKSSSWSDTIAKQMESHNRKFKEVGLREEVADVREIMDRNIDAMVTRGERLDAIQEGARVLAEGGINFNVQARRVQRRMWWQNTKMKIIIGVVVIVIIYVILTASCGGFAWPSCVGGQSNKNSTELFYY